MTNNYIERKVRKKSILCTHYYWNSSSRLDILFIWNQARCLEHSNQLFPSDSSWMKRINVKSILDEIKVFFPHSYVCNILTFVIVKPSSCAYQLISIYIGGSQRLFVYKLILPSLLMSAKRDIMTYVMVKSSPCGYQLIYDKVFTPSNKAYYSFII